MSRRRRKGTKRGWWLWIAGAAAGAIAAYFFVAYRGTGSGTIPLPGESITREAGNPPREEIRESERQALDRVLRDKSR